MLTTKDDSNIPPAKEKMEDDPNVLPAIEKVEGDDLTVLKVEMEESIDHPGQGTKLNLHFNNFHSFPVVQ